MVRRCSARLWKSQLALAVVTRAGDGVLEAERVQVPATRRRAARGPAELNPQLALTQTPSPEITLHTAPLGQLEVLVQPLG